MKEKIQEELLKIPIVKCRFCGFSWSPRVSNPRRCPKCQRRDPLMEMS